ncbi:MAG: pyridoxamine 5'-phosphate oxidase family protein [Deltaproteobacteria bacterium]|nr:pyridoxamine 5'-phosphate oxidase family protein [Deltaproteobacteria bacterium]
MRRAEKAILDPAELETILASATVCRIGLWDGTWPYVVPVNCGYAQGMVYFHSAPEGRKIELLRRGEGRVCVEVEADVAVVPADVPCRSTARYRSVVGFGRADFLDDRKEKRRALELIARQCGAGAGPMSDAAVDAVSVVRVTLEEVTGKRSPA